MRLSYKARRRWSLVLLLVWLPAFIVLVVSLMDWLRPLPIWLELLLFIIAGLVWALPFRSIFLGIGKEDPDRANPED